MSNSKDYLWQFISTGGCSRCNAMEGYYKTKPKKPHPNCRCKIVKVKKKGKVINSSCYSLIIGKPTMKDVNYDSSRDEYRLTFVYSYTLQCRNVKKSTTVSGQVVTHGYLSQSTTRDINVTVGISEQALRSKIQAAELQYEQHVLANAKSYCGCP